MIDYMSISGEVRPVGISDVYSEIYFKIFGKKQDDSLYTNKIQINIANRRG